MSDVLDVDDCVIHDLSHRDDQTGQAHADLRTALGAPNLINALSQPTAAAPLPTPAP